MRRLCGISVACRLFFSTPAPHRQIGSEVLRPHNQAPVLDGATRAKLHDRLARARAGGPHLGVGWPSSLPVRRVFLAARLPLPSTLSTRIVMKQYGSTHISRGLFR